MESRLLVGVHRGDVDSLAGIGMKETVVKAMWGPGGKPLNVFCERVLRMITILTLCKNKAMMPCSLPLAHVRR